MRIRSIPQRSRWWDGNGWTADVSRDCVTWTLPLRPEPPAIKPKTRRVSVWVWILVALLAIILLLLLLAPLVAPVALALLVTGIVGVAKGTPRGCG